MRWSQVLGVGVAVVLSGSAVVAQFVADRIPGGVPQPQTTLPFGGVQPVSAPVGGGQPVGTPSVPTPPAGGYVPPADGFQPAGATMTPSPGFRAGVPATTPPAPVEIPSALGSNHPLALRAEEGAYFILLKSYSRPARPDPRDPGMTALQLAEGLANYVQLTHRARVYLYEHISEEKRAEAVAMATARQRASAFAASLDGYRQKSQLQGMEFLEPDTRVRFQTFRYRDQIGVLTGPFATEDEAVKALAVVKKWPAPQDVRLMDGGALAGTGPDGKQVIEKTFLNPFGQAMMVKNPAAPKSAPAQSTGLDPFVVRLNEGRPYSLLKATRNWTLGVKSFSAPVTFQSKDEDSSMMRKLSFGKGGDVLRAGAEQAEALAKALREMKGPGGQLWMLEAFVLHTRSGSIVTVGQFDGPNDPALLETRRVLSNLTFNLSKDQAQQQLVGTGQKLFGDNILPIPIPKP
ncbi:MAG: hypothetical protein JWO38_4916 [Gemmataceae bacterium]|nr:hypothetical protein [Gemmataceae bacterium]